MQAATLWLTIATLNVYQTFTNPGERYAAIDAELARMKPDIATFQEVKLTRGGSSVDALLPGYHRVVRGRPGGYVQAIVSRFPIVRTIDVRFPNNPSRMALGAVLAVPDGDQTREVLVLTTHLDYQLDHHKQRAAQMAAIFQEAGRFQGPVIVTGDFNFGDGEPENVFPKDFVDTFRAVNGDAPGFTWDRQKNPMADRGSLVGEKSRRLDRIVTRGLVTKSVAIGFNQPIRPGLFPSDHFGLIAHLGVP